VPSGAQTGTALICFSASSAAISATLACGATVMAGDDMTSAAVIGMGVPPELPHIMPAVTAATLIHVKVAKCGAT